MKFRAGLETEGYVFPETPISLNSGVYLKSYKGSHYDFMYIP